MSTPIPDKRGPDADPRFEGVPAETALTVIEKPRLRGRIVPAIRNAFSLVVEKYQCTPLAYKLAFFITLLVVCCMMLFGIILVQQQTRLLDTQISEQGSTLVRLMAESAKEPLLADDELALDAIARSFSGGDSVLGTAIIALDGKIISRSGVLHESSKILPYPLHELLAIEGGGLQKWQWQTETEPQPVNVISFMQPVRFQGISAGHALVTFNQSEMQSFTRRVIHTITAATLLIICLGIGMAFALGRHITQPIDKLVEASYAIGNGDYAYRFKERRRDELGLLMEAFNDMARGMLERSQVKNALSRYVSEGVAQKILSNLGQVELGGKQVEGSVVFADIMGFTSISETTDPEDLVCMLNRYFSLITLACEANNGIVDKYMGDGVMLVFGTLEPDEDHAFHAVRCALLIQKLIENENRSRKKQGKIPIRFRVGINTGKMLAGNMGSPERMQYTVVGDAVNLAARLYAFADSGQIVITEDLYNDPEVKPRVVAQRHASIGVRGREEAVTTYLVSDLAPALQEKIDERIERIVTRMQAA
ncbi:MAG: HAMP domain-containing protein [Pseudomonadota bacterium]|nr:MAG: HAMP domain-containing protein [Pseudomonadota bacterium]